MRPSSLQRREAGFTFIDVSAGLVILVVGVLGYAGTIVYTRNLDRTTRQLCRSNAAAVATLEDVRKDAAGKWASLGSMWDGQTLVAAGAANAVDGTLETTVSADPALLDVGDGMWTPGSLAPNYYHVSVNAESAQNGLANALNYQTYVADRTGFRSLVADPYAGPAVVGGQGDSLDPVARNVTVSGSHLDRLAFQLMNSSLTPLRLTSVYVSFSGGSGFDKLDLAGSPLHDAPGGLIPYKLLAPKTTNHQLALSPGLVDVSLRGVEKHGHHDDSIVGHQIELRLGFSDGSQADVVVNP